MESVHRAAAQGFARAAAGYERGRPDYPAALDGWLRDAVKLGPGTTVVDLGAGTGKFVPRLLATGATVIAVEPVDAMRAALAARHPTVRVLVGVADALPLPEASVDAIVCAQAFHWFATPEAVAEMARVLRPDGVLALVWNVRDESVPWVAALTRIFGPHEGDAPRYAKGDWRRVFPAAGFGPLDETRFSHTQVGTPEQVIVERCLSISFVAAAPATDRARIERRLRELIAADPELAGRAEVAFPYTTVAFSARRST